MGFLESLAISKVMLYAGGFFGAWLLGWILKAIPNEKIKIFVGEIMYGLGVTITLGLSKWTFTKSFWNKTIEPWFIDAFENIIGEGIRQFILGLRSDN